MLNRIEWDKSKVQADVFSLKGLIAWLEKQPGWAEYNVLDAENCMLGQWTRFIDPSTKYETFGGPYEYIIHGRRVDLIKFKQIAINSHNFGAALERARKLASSPVQP